MPPRGVVPVVPGEGQESVWAYPRPPDLRPSDRVVVVVLGGAEVCRTRRALRLRETSHPPTWYLPAEDWLPGSLQPADGSSLCEWKGVASYLAVLGGADRADRAAWTYDEPTPAYAALRGTVALYPAAVDGCFVDGERVRPQQGGFYGGWVTDDVVGPFKGGPGSRWW